MSATQPTLPRAPRAHDLPPRWDGREVEWRGWSKVITGTVCPPRKPDACPLCGSPAEPAINLGAVWADYAVEGILTIRKARLCERVVVVSLAAWRCPDCRGDWVTRQGSDELWVLDDSDYTDEGSWNR